MRPHTVHSQTTTLDSSIPSFSFPRALYQTLPNTRVSGAVVFRMASSAGMGKHHLVEYHLGSYKKSLEEEQTERNLRKQKASKNVKVRII